MAERRVVLDFDDGSALVVIDERPGAELIADSTQVVKTLTALTRPIERIAREVLEAAKQASPSRAAVELAFGVAIEQGQLVALLGKGKAEGSIKITLEWESGG
jgi:hypothetical protein